MKFIEEVVVEEFLPTFRSLLAADLRERGLTQHEVAELLGVSQSAVSKYAHGDVTTDDEIAADDRVQELVERTGSGLATGNVSQVQALVEAEVLVRELSTSSDILAERHEAANPALADYDGDFTVHDADSEVRVREHVLSSVRRGVRMLERTSGFATQIPAVGANLVECTPDADTVEDVAGVPGRVLDVMGRTEIPAEPEFGVSAYVATVLLDARAAGVDAHAALNIAYSADTVAALADAGYAVVEFEPEGESTTDDHHIRDAVRDADAVDVLYQTGGYGVEPIVYVLAENAPDAVRMARGLL
ncbi:thiamine-phosphate synthase family protein [Halobacterium salinarum]|uniref:thiamine-phosphate synthase family protein n=1 Tax=Halobacterium salinarum TaxID=2242 RepID=UPI001F46D84C|nr:thiamine-phosphate synthase family protein [Halobacterium salinarum]MCF2237898.1 helix-turn-helix domain-containing protein [Halobacterium salinarum]MDL0120182.1 helix-turn-helix domain-containing protein [Halobacterium salinarum]MDL0142975.1 helix-turn-helix domain-containing protein [Halobacterium salinarum]